MVSSSTSSIQKRFKYEVFLSFRGADTRNNFVTHLYDTLKRKSIETYKDDAKIKKGENISNELITAIENSKFYIIVFSKNYASSRWCLNELVKIIECQRSDDHTAYPLFYDVEPSEVRNQSGTVQEAFAKNEKEEAAGKWKEALKEAGGLAGWELKNTADGDEAKLIKTVVEELSLALRSIRFNIDEDLVGMESRIKEVLSSFGTDSNDVRMIGIKGIGGGGKTTLARAVYDQISHEFEGKSFVENVREESKPSLSGLKSLQRQVLMDVSNDRSIQVSSVSDGKHMMKKMMYNKKVLVVLDDVDRIDQLQALAGDPNWFMPGSRIIITTREGQVLEAHGVKFGVLKFIHDVCLLSKEEANCLFNKYAFGGEIPTQDYEEPSRQVLRYADGLPLTIKVLGSDLCGQNVFHWNDVLERLKEIPLHETQKQLEISYTSLEEDHKEIFLDVVCLFKNWKKCKVIIALESCGFHPRSGLRVLEQKSLITVDDYGYIVMHDHIAEMGRNIVRRSHPPCEHSRLWDWDEIECIFTKDLGTEATRCIQLEFAILDPCIMVKGLRKMKQLRFLYVGGRDFFSDLEFDIADSDFPDALRYVEWTCYPFRSLPRTFQANNLVTLEMRKNNMVQLWEGEERKVLNKLKNLDLSDSRLMSTLDLRLAPNLENLMLCGCTNLVELHMPSNLIDVTISGSRLRTLNLSMALNLESLHLGGCNDLVELHMPSNLISATISGSRLRTLNLSTALNLKNLNLDECNDLEELHMPSNLIDVTISGSRLRTLNLSMALNLESLHLGGCNDLVELHMPSNLISVTISGSRWRTLNLSTTLNLKNLNLDECNDLEELHMPSNLIDVTISGSRLRTLNLSTALNLENLVLGECNDLEELHMPSNIIDVTISGSRLRTLNLSTALNLENLVLGECNDLEELHMPSNLISVTISGSRLRTLNLSTALNLKNLDLGECNDLEELHMPSNLIDVTISGSRLRTLNLSTALNLENLILGECNDLEELHMPVECLNLTAINISYSKLRTLVLGQTPNIEVLGLRECKYLETLQMSGECQKLLSLQITCPKLMPLDFGLTPNLHYLNLSNSYDLKDLLMGDGFQKLTDIHISGSKLRALDLGLIPNVEMLHLTNCRDLEELHMTGECQKLLNLEISNSRLRTLDLGLIPNLEKLRLKESWNLVELHISNECSKNPVNLNVSDCYGFDFFSFYIRGYTSCNENKSESLEALEVDYSAELYLTAASLESCPLHPDCTLPKYRFSCDYKQDRPSLTRNLEMLLSLGMCACTNLETFSRSICGLRLLRKLKLAGSILDAPLDLGQLECLELVLSSTKVNHLPDSICMLKSLQSLKIESCLFLDKLPEDLGRLDCLEKLTLSSSTIEHLPDSICMLKSLRSLKLKFCWLLERLPEDAGKLKCLKKLKLSSAKIKHLPDSICMLKHLESLQLSPCLLLEELPEDLGRLECLKELIVSSTVIRHLPNSICMLKQMKYLKLDTCLLLEKLPEDLGQLECLEELIVSSTVIKHIPESICLLKHLKSLQLSPCMLLEELPEDLGRLECLEELILSSTVIKYLPDSICMLKHLKNLQLNPCVLLEKLPEDVGQLECLEELILSSTVIKHLPDSICMSKQMNSLNLHKCSLLEKLPGDLGRLECLQSLILSQCETLQDIPNSICEMKCLSFIDLRDCIRVEKLPEELGRLECLNTLDIEGTSISHLPQSILLSKSLLIYGSRGILESCWFTSEIHTLADGTSYAVLR